MTVLFLDGAVSTRLAVLENIIVYVFQKKLYYFFDYI